MKIALLAPLGKPMKSPFYNGLEVFINDLALELAKRQHDVWLFAAKGSQLEALTTEDRVAANRVQIKEIAFDKILFDSAEPEFIEGMHISAFNRIKLYFQVFLQVAEADPPFDIVHANIPEWEVYAFSALSSIPLIHTFHLPATKYSHENLINQIAYKLKGSNHAVTVSEANSATYGNDFKFDRIIHLSVKPELIPFRAKSEDFLLFAGRVCDDKGADLAIEIAKKAGRKLVLAGRIQDVEFFKTKIEPELQNNPDIVYIGRRSRAIVYELMSQAAGFLFPIRWEEPGATVVLEAMAAGTPVIGWQRGVVPELVINERTGFLVPYLDIEAAATAVGQLETLSRTDCRSHIETYFSSDRMLEAYESYYRDVQAQSICKAKVGNS